MSPFTQLEKTMSAFITAINAALNAAHAYGDALAKARECPEIKGKGEEAVRAALLPVVGAYYAVPLIDGEGKAKGRKVFDKAAPKYEAAKKALQRLLSDLMGKAVDKGEELEVPPHIAKLAAQLAQACAEYEQARKLASTAIAAAFAK
jgi:hypothetical protein